MSVKFTGDQFSATERVKTGLHSLDWSLGDHLGNVGWPMKTTVELYGGKNVGKTTFALSVAGILASELKRDFALLDWEIQNRETVKGVLEQAGFDGTVRYFLNLADETSEDTAARFVTDALYSDPQPIALMDSIGAFRPTANMEGGLADANIGAFAREIGRLSDWFIASLQRSKHPGCIMMTNHEHPTIGSRIAGTDTAGGVKKKYLAMVRILLKRTFLKTGRDDDKESGSIVDFGHSWLLGGRIDSSRVGYSKREFNVFMIAGEGIHKGLTAVFDCVVDGLATVSSKKVTESTTVTIDGESYKLRNLIDQRHDPDLFIPFTNALMAQEVIVDQGNGYAEVVIEPKKRGRKKKK